MKDLPEPLVPAEVELRDFQFIPIDINRLFSSEFHARADDAQWRAGVTLWLKSFHQSPAASIPNDDTALARLAEFGRDVKSWLKVKHGALYGWILCSDNRWYHPVVAEKAMEAWRKKEAQRERSRKGNHARWGRRGDSPDDPDGTAMGIPKGLQQGSITESLNDPKGQGQGQGIDESPSTPKIAFDERMEIGKRIQAAMRVEGDPTWQAVFGWLEAWVTRGADPIADVLATVQEMMAGRQNPPRSLNYFNGQIGENMEARLRREAEPTPENLRTDQPVDVETARWKARLTLWRKSEIWDQSHGPAPGEPGCRVPAHLLVEAAA